MKNLFYLIAVFTGLLLACNSTKNTGTAASAISKLNGTWELVFINAKDQSFDSLFANKKPTMVFDIAQKVVSGNTSCNNFSGPLKADGAAIDFKTPMAMTKMMCMDGNGENVFLETLNKVNTWSLSDEHTLHFMTGEMEMM
jgi:heat shock protein HslJ